MRPIDRILACTARVFGLSSARAHGVSVFDRIREVGSDGIEVGVLECCAAEGLAAERLMRELDDGPAR